MLDDCEHMIDGWYDDGKYENTGIRWEAHEEEDIANHIVLIDNFGDDGLMKITNDQGLKAAHGKDAKDKFSYPGLDKQVGDDDEPMNDEDVDAAAGQTVNFQLTSNVPDDLRNYLKPEPVDPPVIEGQEPGVPGEGTLPEGEQQRGSYTLTFHDVMDSNLEMIRDSLEVWIGETKLDTQYYEVNYTPTAHGDGDTTTTCTFEVTIDLVELYEKEIIDDSDIEDTTAITVTYNAKLSDDATAGTYENEAWTTVTENGWESSPDIVEVNTYAIKIFKYDQETNKALPGATFTLYSNQEATEPVEGVEPVLTDNDGYADFSGLDAGTYYLKETEAPEGYVCSSEVLEIVIPGDDVGADNIVNVKFANSLIPHTGGMGTTLFSIVGGALIVMAGTIFVISRRKRRA